MNWDAIAAIGEMLGAAAVIITLIYLAKQIQQNTVQTRLNSIQAVNASNDSAFEPIYIPENSIIFAKGQHSYADLTQHEAMVFQMLMTRLLASFVATSYHHRQGSYDGEMYQGTVRYYASFFSTPGGAIWYATARANFPDFAIAQLDAEIARAGA